MQPLNRITVTSLFLMVTLILVMPVWADWIDNLYCDPDSFEWWRDGQKQDSDDLGPYFILEKGDKIKVIKSNFNGKEGKECFITLKKSKDDKGITLTHTNTPIDGYLIESNNTSFSFLKNFTELFKGYWTYDNHMNQFYLKAPRELGALQQLTLRIPLLEGDDAQLEAGKRILYLGWDGGIPPYNIKVIYKETQTVFLDEPNINEETVTSKKQDWIVGSYQVIVSDSAKNKVKQEFTVVNFDEALSFQNAKKIKQSHLPEKTTKPTLLATLMKKNTKWRLEAYQLVAPIDKEYYPAFLIKQGLKDVGQ